MGGELNANEYITSPSYSYGSRNTAKMGWKDSKKKKGTQAVCDEIVEMAGRQDWNSGNIHGHVNIKGGTFHEIPTPEKELQVTVTVMTAQRRTISLTQG